MWRGSPRRGRGANFFLLDEDVSQNGTGGWKWFEWVARFSSVFFCGRGSHLHCVEFHCNFEVGFILSAPLIMIAQALGSPRFPKHVVMDPQAMEGCRSLHRSGILSGIACGPCFFPALCFQTLNFFCHVMDSNYRIKSIRFKNKFASKKHLCQESRHKILGR